MRSGIQDDLAADDQQVGADVGQGVLGRRERILVEDGDVGELAELEGVLVGLFGNRGFESMRPLDDRDDWV